MKKLLSLSLLIILTAGFFAGCKKEKGNPPIIPPEGSMTIDFSDFDSQAKSGGMTANTKGTENSAWEYVAGKVFTWNSLISATLVVPVAAFRMAVNQNPSWVSEKTWQWSYSVPAGGVTYKAKLIGVIRATDVEWKMYVTKDGTGGYTDFLWFEGTSEQDGTAGTWTLYESNLVPNAFMKIDWTNTGTSAGTVKYTYVKSGAAFKDSYITYGLTNASLNAFYTLHYKVGDSFLEINVEWNTLNGSGRIKSLNYPEGGTNTADTWYCWNENRINILCP